MKRALLVSTVLHLVLLAGLVFFVGKAGASWKPVIAVHLGRPRTSEASVVSVSAPTPVNTLASLARAPARSESAAGLPGDNLAIDTLTPGAAVEKPVLVSYPAPVYPREARRNSWEGVVEVEITVDETGRSSGLKVLKSSGHPALDDAALDALRQARYDPATLRGVAESGVLDAVVRFRLN